jgi:hypothetical protein
VAFRKELLRLGSPIGVATSVELSVQCLRMQYMRELQCSFYGADL